MDDERLARAVRSRAHDGKVAWGRNTAMRVAATMREQGALVEAYRCPFGCGDGHWHVGRAMSMYRIEEMARVLRARHARRGVSQ